MLKTFKFKSSVSFGTYTLLDRESKKMQHPAHHLDYPQTGSNVILAYTHSEVINKSRLSHTFLIAKQHTLCMVRGI